MNVPFWLLFAAMVCGALGALYAEGLNGRDTSPYTWAENACGWSATFWLLAALLLAFGAFRLVLAGQ